MASIFGRRIQVSVWGQSHSPAIGVTVDGLPAGEAVDTEVLQAFLNRRAPGQADYATPRKEEDRPEFLSGLVGNITCGAPLTALIRNTNTKSQHYDNLRDVPRPGHGDYAIGRRFHGFQDVAGGGHTSGRLTAPICVAGGICMQILARRGIQVRAHIASLGGVADTVPDYCSRTPLPAFSAGEFPVLSPEAGEKMHAAILEAKSRADSVGGVIECLATGVPAGLGSPMFDGVENRLAAALFGIPAVKGVEFGNGFAAAGLTGSENNDPFVVEDGQIRTAANRHGGILGGVTSGMPIVFRVAVKPTPSIGQPQRSVRLSTNEEEELVIHGRHDPCIVPRAVPVVEAVAAIVLLELLLEGEAV